jgi:hypothetical protein
MADQVTTGRFVGCTQELARLRQLLARAALELGRGDLDGPRPLGWWN